jgi:hypothetical protein
LFFLAVKKSYTIGTELRRRSQRRGEPNCQPHHNAQVLSQVPKCLQSPQVTAKRCLALTQISRLSMRPSSKETSGSAKTRAARDPEKKVPVLQESGHPCQESNVCCSEIPPVSTEQNEEFGSAKATKEKKEEDAAGKEEPEENDKDSE